ncbi:MAG: biotin--[acetyl-CoA-carboxylase] ligase [bacterium]
MGGKEMGVRSDVSFTFYFLLSTFYFLFSGEKERKLMWQAQEIKENLVSKIFGRQIHTFDEVGSTQDIAHSLAAFGAPEGTLVIAEIQTEGKGQPSKTWISPKGGLWFSLVLTPTLMNINQASGLTILVALSIARAIKEMTNLNILIKWPNDLYLNNKKVGGILTESSTVEVAVRYIIIGVGINVNVDSQTLPSKATSLKDALGKEIPIIEILAKILEGMEKDYLKFKKVQNLAPFLNEINQLSSIVGRHITVQLPDKSIEGSAVSIDGQGRLLVELENGETEIITAGEVMV